MGVRKKERDLSEGAVDVSKKTYQKLLNMSPSPRNIIIEENESLNFISSPSSILHVKNKLSHNSQINSPSPPQLSNLKVNSGNNNESKLPISNFLNDSSDKKLNSRKASRFLKKADSLVMKINPINEEEFNLTERMGENKSRKTDSKKTFPILPIIFSKKKIIKLKELQSCFSAPSSKDKNNEDLQSFHKLSSYPNLKREGSFRRIFSRIFNMLSEVKKFNQKISHQKSQSMGKNDFLTLTEKIMKKSSSPDLKMDQTENEKYEKLEIISFNSQDKNESFIENKNQIYKNEEIAKFEETGFTQLVLNIQEEKPKKEILLIPNFKSSFEEITNNLTLNENLPIHRIEDLIIEEKGITGKSQKDSKNSNSMWKPRSSNHNIVDSSKMIKIDNVVIHGKSRNKIGDSSNLLDYLEDEQIEEFYQCLEKKPQIIKNLNALRKSIREQSGLEIITQEENPQTILKEHGIWLSFSEDQKDLEEDFYRKLFEKNRNNDHFLLSFLCVFLFVMSFFKFFLQDRYSYITEFTIGNMILIFIIFIMMCFSHKITRIYKALIPILITIYGLISVVALKFNAEDDMIVPELMLILIYYSVSQLSFLTLKHVVVLTCTYFLLYLSVIILSVYEHNLKLIIAFLSFGLWNLSMKYFKIKMEIDFFNKMRITEYEKKRLNEIIQYLLPPHVSIGFRSFKSIIFLKFRSLKN